MAKIFLIIWIIIKIYFKKKEIEENVLIPDEILKPTIKDYVNNRDYVLEKILDSFNRKWFIKKYFILWKSIIKYQL